jgi:hypothetical protein
MLTIKRLHWASTPALALLLGGCATADGAFPSLAKRPFERNNQTQQAPATTAPVTNMLPTSLQNQAGGYVNRTQKAHNAFEASLNAARAAAQAAAGAASGSERWVNAHVMVSRADGARADAVAALSDMDALITQQRGAGAGAGLIALLAEQQSRIADILSAEAAEIDRLTKIIGR